MSNIPGCSEVRLETWAISFGIRLRMSISCAIDDARESFSDNSLVKFSEFPLIADRK